MDGVSESPRASAEVTVQNSPPGAPQVAIEPEVAHTGDELTCRVTVPSVDPDGDEVTYTFAWWRNDKPLPGASESGQAAADGDHQAAIGSSAAATPSDGTARGPAAYAERVIANSPPGPARAALVPRRPRVGQPLRCEVTTRSVDPDGDPVRYRYRWQRNGAPQPFAETSGRGAGPHAAGRATAGVASWSRPMATSTVRTRAARRSLVEDSPR